MIAKPLEQVVTRPVYLKDAPHRSLGVVRFDRDRKPFSVRSVTSPYAVWLYPDVPRHFRGRIQLTPDELARFMSHVDRSAGDDKCWRWNSTLLLGYATFSLRRKCVRACRIAYEHFVGEIPKGHQIDHVWERGCVFYDCVNPAHLEPVTPMVNVHRGRGPNTTHATKTHCHKGHPLEGDNLVSYYLVKGIRKCRTCYRQWLHDYGIKKRAAKKVLAADSTS